MWKLLLAKERMMLILAKRFKISWTQSSPEIDEIPLICIRKDIFLRLGRTMVISNIDIEGV